MEDEVVAYALNGGPLLTGTSLIRVTACHSISEDVGEDVLLLEAVRRDGVTYRAWTTVAAMTFAIETGGWRIWREEDHRLVA